MKLFNWAYIKKSILYYILVHLFLSIISLPILIAWGLPLSLLSPLGNFVFTPFLMIFLLLSSLLFFTELLFIPNMWLACALNQFTQWWVTILSFSSQQFLISFVKPPLIILLCIPLIAFIILLQRSFNLIQRIALLISLLLGNYLFITCSTFHQNQVIQVPCNNKEVTIISSSKVCILDPGIIGRHSSASSWVQYTLFPELNKQLGINEIDFFIVTKPSVFLFEALTQLCEQHQIKTIYLPYWKGMISLSAWKKYKQLQRVAEQANVKIIRINKEMHIKLSENTNITVTPSNNKASYHDATFNQLCINGIIDNKPYAFL